MTFKHAGRRFSLLTVVAPDPDRPGRWICDCDCGTKGKSIRAGDLRSGDTTSCRCVHSKMVRDRRLSHGKGNIKDPEWRAWSRMKSRCFNHNDKSYKDYGKRGVTVHPAWIDDFQAFFDHVGPRPSPKHSLDRRNTNGNYEPGNTRWATAIEQNQNRRPPRRRKHDLPQGVNIDPKAGVKRYRAATSVGGVRRFLGRFSTIEEASAAYQAAVVTYGLPNPEGSNHASVSANP